jgi:arginase
MSPKSISLLGAPVQSGTSRKGCMMGPDAFRTAGLGETLQELGHSVTDLGNVDRPTPTPSHHNNSAVLELDQTVAWSQALTDAAYSATKTGVPIFLGGDHSLCAGTVPGVAKFAAELNQPQFILWLDAHPDSHTLTSTTSGNLHGTPTAYFTGQSGFEGIFPPLEQAVPEANICMMGIRSVDPYERAFLEKSQITVLDMRAIDELGIVKPLRDFLARVKASNGRLHLSLDVDFLDPSIAPGVGTTVPGGATFREAHLIMETLCDSDLVTSLDLVELNPFLDERGRTAQLMVDLCASLLGRKVLDRPTQSF